MHSLRATVACVALFSAAASPAAYEFYVTVKAASQEGRSGPILFFVEGERGADGTPGRAGVIRLVCADGAVQSASLLWTGDEGGRKMMGAPKIGEATAISSIGLPKITPKIAKESHGKRTAAPSSGWEPIDFADSAAACAAAAEAARSINTSRSNVKGR